MNKENDELRKDGINKLNKDVQNLYAYESNYEYLMDELRWLKVLLKLHLEENADEELQGQFLGIAISKEEICDLLEINLPKEYDKNFLVNQLVQMEKHIDEACETSLCKGIFLPLPYICKILGLSSFEKHCIVVCLASELRNEYQSIYAYFQNDMNRKWPGIELMLRLFAHDEEERMALCSVFDRQAPLMRFLMSSESDDSNLPLISRSLKLDDWVVNLLLGSELLDWRLENIGKLTLKSDIAEVDNCDDINDKLREFINYYWPNRGYGVPQPIRQIFYFHGPPGAGKKTHAMTVCKKLGMSLISVDIEKLLDCDMPFYQVLHLLVRQVMLQNTALCIEKFDILLSEDGRYETKLKILFEMLEEYVPLTFIFGTDYWRQKIPKGEVTFVTVDFAFPTEAERNCLWKELSEDYVLSKEIRLEKFSSKFRFTPGNIKAALSLGENLAVWNNEGSPEIGESQLYSSCYSQSNSGLSSIAQKVKAMYSWDMLVLPDNQMTQLNEICNQMKYRNVVYEEWGFDKRLSSGKGLNVLFAGPPGSGKTMAAEVIAVELNLEMYKIDLSQIVSKYIGETEKNLARIFMKAETSNAILFFDEADSLFGKRTEVKDAHDRYANIEISYLLQKMEEYKGLVILATNLNQNMDEAFLRRLNFSVLFPFPEKKQRERIWRGMFPKGAPLDEDIDYDFMAEKFVLSGGNIKNMALGAAFYAAEASSKISMKHIMLAAKREYQKLDKTFLKSDFSPYYQLIEVI